MKVYVEKINESTLKVYSDDWGIEQEMNTYFEFYVPGYRFMPAFKNKIWDGKARLYDVHRKSLPNGLLEYVRLFCDKNDYELVEQDGIRPSKEKITIEEVQLFVNKLNIHSKGKKIELRDYQIDAIAKAINREKILALSPTSSGKSAIIYVVIRYLLLHEARTILMVPTTSLVTQMYNDFKDYSSEVKWDVADHCHMLHGGQPKEWDKPVLITTWQSIHSITKKRGTAFNEFYKSWDAYIGDEAHRFASNSLQQISNKLVNAKYRLGTTGTVQDDKVSKLNLEGSFGPIYRVITTKELMQNKQVVDLKIKCITLNYGDEIKQAIKGSTYQKEMDFICMYPKRNKFIANLAKATNGNTLVLFQFVEKHGKPLYEMIKQVCPEKDIFYISGETDVKVREEIRQGLDKFNNAVIVASSSILSTGVNIPSIENIIFASPTKSKIRNLQSIGRGLRLKEGKDYCTLFDISDNLAWKSKVNHTLKHFKERIDVYNKEEFKFTMTTINI